MSTIQIISILVAIIMVSFIFSMIRRRRLREEYSLLWIVGSIVMVVFILWRDLLDILAGYLGIFYPPNVLLMIGLFFGVLMFLHFTLVISRQADDNKRLVQRMALLQNRIEELERALNGKIS